MLWLSLERRQADRARGRLDGYGESDADEDPLLGRVEKPGDDAHHLALRGHEGPARVPRIGGGIELDEVGQHALALGRAVFAAQARHHPCRYRGTDAEREAHRHDVVAEREILGGAHGGRDEVVRNRLRLQHCQVLFGMQPYHGTLGFQAVEKDELQFGGVRNDVEVGEDDASIDDDHPRTDAALYLVAVLVDAHAAHAHHRGADDLVGLRHARRQRIVFQRAHYGRVDVLLGQLTRRRRGCRVEEYKRCGESDARSKAERGAMPRQEVAHARRLLRVNDGRCSRRLVRHALRYGPARTAIKGGFTHFYSVDSVLLLQFRAHYPSTTPHTRAPGPPRQADPAGGSASSFPSRTAPAG